MKNKTNYRKSIITFNTKFESIPNFLTSFKTFSSNC